MGTITLQGSSTLQSSPVRNDYIDGIINTRPSPDRELIDQTYVKNTYTNKQAINIDRNASIIKTLKGYADGSPIIVTYLHQQNSTADKRTNTSDVSTVTSSVHMSYLQINNFEIKLKSAMSYTYDNDNNVSAIVGEALIYPGFNPQVGDLFIYTIDDKLGVFKINNPPTRLSIRSGSMHDVSFELIEFADREYLDNLGPSIRDISWFNKQRFLTEDAALLKSDEYILSEDIDYMLSLLVPYYCDKFFEQYIHRTFIRPDGIYDPYIISYITNCISFTDIRSMPEVLLSKVAYSNKAIWSKLDSPDSITWTNVMNKCIYVQHTVSMLSSSINSLMNKYYVKLVTDDDITALAIPEEDVHVYFDSNITNLDTTTHTAFDNLIMRFVDEFKIDTKQLIDLVQEYQSLTDMEQFYRIPIYMNLLLKIKQMILTGKGNISYETAAPRYISGTFTADQLTDNKLTVTHEYGDIILPCVVVKSDNLRLDDDFYTVKYVENAIELDFSTYVSAGNTVAGIWRYVFGSGNTAQ